MSGRTSVAQGVHAQALRTPEAVAVVDGAHRLDYAALDAAGSVVAQALTRSGVQPGQAVAIGLPRSWQLICAMLGVLRLGAQVVPLDGQSPAERRRHILTDSAAVALIHGDAPPADLPDSVRPLAVADLLAAQPGEVGEPEPPAPASFLFYTSGTTGRPKGVEVRDAGVLRLARPGYLRIEPGTRYSCLSNPAFDALSFEVWVPLLTGGCCVVLADEAVQTPHELAAALRRERVDTVWMTAALFNAVVDAVPDCFAAASQVLVGGEQLNAALIRRWYRDNPDSTTQLYNGYGPTESTTFALSHPIPREFGGDSVPIGRPLPGTEALLVVPGAERTAEPGELAELHLAGDGLAVGYRNLPEETAHRFVTLPWYDEGRERYYRTGDLVRADAEGLVEYVGRTDRQVKVRGFRVEPGELERRILAHPAVRQAYVCTRRDGAHGPNELLAYLVAEDLSYEEFDRHLAGELPSYMRPHHVYRVDALPLNANGKVDQAALLSREDRPWRRESTEDTAVTAWQREVLDLVSQVLGIADPRLGDHWIAGGGDSLKALRLRFAARQRWGCELPQSVVLHGDFAELAATIAAARTGTTRAYPVPAAPTGASSAPATSEQQRLWLFQQSSPRSLAYNVNLAFRIDGEVDAAALRGALRGLVERHPALRTSFEATTEGLRQVVCEPYDPWTESSRDEFFGTAFDLAQHHMLRASWVPGQGGGELLLCLHHIAVDGWSLNVLLRDLSAGYAQTPLSDSARTPLDFAAWQTEWFASPAYLAKCEELRAHYAQVDRAPEPLRPAKSPAAALLHTTLDTVRREQVDRLCAELGLTRFQLLLGVYVWSLYGVTGRRSPCVASPVANRPVQEFESSVGMFANTVLLPQDVVPGEDLRGQLLRLGAATREVLDRQEVALSDVLAAGQSPIDFLFVLENTEFSALALPGCAVRPLWPVPAAAKCPLTMSVVAGPEGFDCLWEYAQDCFEPAEVVAMAELFERGLDLLAAGGAATPAELVASYRRSLPEHGRGEQTPLHSKTIADLVARQVVLTPQAPALMSADGPVSYAELDAYATALAAELPAPTGSCSVALYFEPSVEHVVSLLALAKLNLTAVPLDPAYPPDLLRQVIEQVDPLCVLLAPGAEFDVIDPGDVPRHPVVLSAAEAPAVPPHEGTRPLYTLFTSGSTGTPKGVQVPDRTLVNLLQWQAGSGGLALPAATQQFSMLSFDVSFQEVFGTLSSGGCLHLVRPDWRHDVPALLDQLESAGVERIFLPYVALQLLAEHGVRLGRYPSRLRDVVTAGEQLVCTEAIRRWFAGLPGARLFNHYGPTETHVVSSLCLDGDPARWPERPAIGRPVPNAVLRVVDESDQAVPPGCVGDLLIGGLAARRCYLGDPERDAERFVELPGVGLCYRSGDKAYFDRDGLLHFVGREDQQIKLSGYRLELGQVEAALLRHPEVVNAAVVRDGDSLVACVQCRQRPTAEELAAHLAQFLPAHARVDRFRLLADLPRTPSGKVDRAAALRAPGEDLRRGGAANRPMLSPREAQLAELFEQATGSPIGPDQTFFQAGASSLGLMRFHLHCTRELGPIFTVADLFEHVTVRALARMIGGPEPVAAQEVEPIAAEFEIAFDSASTPALASAFSSV